MHISKSVSFIAVAVVVFLVLASVAFVTPLAAGAANASKAAVATPYTARVGNVSTAAVKTPPVVGAGVWHTQTVDSAGADSSLQLTPTGWPAISYYGRDPLMYAYKLAS
jgi:hypothetical protein